VSVGIFRGVQIVRHVPDHVTLREQVLQPALDGEVPKPSYWFLGAVHITGLSADWALGPVLVHEVESVREPRAGGVEEPHAHVSAAMYLHRSLLAMCLEHLLQGPEVVHGVVLGEDVGAEVPHTAGRAACCFVACLPVEERVRDLSECPGVRIVLGAWRDRCGCVRMYDVVRGVYYIACLP
jgi:hypothetical protein